MCVNCQPRRCEFLTGRTWLSRSGLSHLSLVYELHHPSLADVASKQRVNKWLEGMGDKERSDRERAPGRAAGASSVRTLRNENNWSNAKAFTWAFDCSAVRNRAAATKWDGEGGERTRNLSLACNRKSKRFTWARNERRKRSTCREPWRREGEGSGGNRLRWTAVSGSSSWLSSNLPYVCYIKAFQ